jgi:hypothetical protein
MGDPTDVTALVADIEAEVGRRRQSGGYPRELVERLKSELEIDQDVEPIEALANVGLHRPIYSRAGAAGWAIVHVKRAIRRAVAWYVVPMFSDQMRFNRAAATELRSAEQRLSRLEPPWRREPGAAPLESGVDRGRLLELRAGAAIRALEGVTTGRICVVGPHREAIGQTLTSRGFALAPAHDRHADDPMAALQALRTTPAAAVVALGVLTMMSAADVVRFIPESSRMLIEDGVIVVDGFEGAGGILPDSVDVAQQRWLSTGTAELLFSAAGFRSTTLMDEQLGTHGFKWFAMVGSRAAR